MKKYQNIITRFFPWLIIAALLFFLLRGCDRYKPVPDKVETKTTVTPVTGEVSRVPVPVEVDTVWALDTLYIEKKGGKDFRKTAPVPEMVKKQGAITLKNEYDEGPAIAQHPPAPCPEKPALKYYYRDTVKMDSLGYVFIIDTTAGPITGRRVAWNLKKYETTTTITHTPKPRVRLLFGPEAIYQRGTGDLSAGAALALQMRNGSIISVSGGQALGGQGGQYFKAQLLSVIRLGRR